MFTYFNLKFYSILFKELIKVPLPKAFGLFISCENRNVDSYISPPDRVVSMLTYVHLHDIVDLI